MRAALFFVYLCLLTLMGTQPSAAADQAATHTHVQYSIAQKLPYVHYHQAQTAHSVIRHRNVDTEKRYYMADGAEDEDGTDPSPRKFKLHTRSLLTFYTHLFTSYLHRQLPEAPGATGLDAAIYIKHCTFRV